MTGLVFRKITSSPGDSPLTIDDTKTVRRAYRKFGFWCLKEQDTFRRELIATNPDDRLHFLSTRLQRNFNNTDDDNNMPRLLVQHRAIDDLPPRDDPADIEAYHGSRELDVRRESDTSGSEESILVLPPESALTNPNGDFEYLKPLLIMIFRQMVLDPTGDKFLHSFFGTMLAAKCR